MGKDPLNKHFGEDWARLTKDLLFDSKGSLKFKTHLWSGIRKVILPTLFDKVGYIPKLSPYSAITDEQHHEFTLTFSQMQADMHDFVFYYRKKAGIPRLSDSDLADLVLGGEGLSVKAIRDPINTSMEYVDGQLVAIRDRMATAKATDGESLRQALKYVV